MVKVTLPEMGESVTEGSIVEWRKRVGDFVAEGDTLGRRNDRQSRRGSSRRRHPASSPAFSAAKATRSPSAPSWPRSTRAKRRRRRTAQPSGCGETDATAPLRPPLRLRAGPPKLVDVTLPEMGESVTEGSIVEFRVKPGDFVNEGDTDRRGHDRQSRRRSAGPVAPGSSRSSR